MFKGTVKILLIDDSRFLRISNEKALTRAGYEVISAGDGEEGLRLAREQKPDLVVLDMMLPKLSGLEVLRELRKGHDTAALPVMVLSSLPQANDEKLLSEGAACYFEKGRLLGDQNPEALVKAVGKMLSWNHSARA